MFLFRFSRAAPGPHPGPLPPSGRGGLLLVGGGFGWLSGEEGELVVFVWGGGGFLFAKGASLPSRCLGRSRTAPTDVGLGVRGRGLRVALALLVGMVGVGGVFLASPPRASPARLWLRALLPLRRRGLWPCPAPRPNPLLIFPLKGGRGVWGVVRLDAGLGGLEGFLDVLLCVG